MAFMIFLLIVVITLFIITILKVNKNTQRIEELKWQLIRMRKMIESGVKSTSVKSSPEAKAEPEKSKPAKPVVPVKSGTPPEITFDKLSASSYSESAKQVIAEKKSMTRNEWEILIGGKILNRIGALAIIIGISFFLKYAFDNDWISESVRVIIGGIIGFLFIGGGLRSNKKDYKIFSQGLSGTGITILYLSVYASFNYYYLVSQPVAFILMAGVTVLTFAQAFYFNSMAVSLLGLLGGFMTPFLLSTGQANEVGLFSYVALLNVGLIWVAMRKSSWMILESLALAATYIIYNAWYIEYFESDKSTVALIYLTIFWGIFFSANLIHILKSNRLNRELRLVTVSVNLFLYSIASYIIIEDIYPDWTGAAAALLAVIHLMFYYYIQKSRTFFDYELNFALLSTVILFSFFIYFQFTGFWIITFWAVNLLLLIWLGTKYKTNLLIKSGVILTFIIIIQFLGTEGALIFEPVKEFTFLINLRALSYLTLSLVFGLGATLLSKSEFNNAKTLRSGYLYLLCVALFVFITVETNDYFRTIFIQNQDIGDDVIRFKELLTLSGLWVYYSLILVFAGYRKNIIEFIISSICILGLGIIMAVLVAIDYYPIKDFVLAFNFRALILILILFSTITHLILLRNNRDLYHWLEDFYKIIQVALVIIFLALVTFEIKDYYNKEIFLLDSNSYNYSEMLDKLENLQQMLLSTSWLVVSSVLIVTGIWKKIRIIRITAIVLFGMAILKMFIYDLSFLDTIYRIISFIGLGLILLAASFIYQKYKKFIFN
jgi:uncharacterized membrane protein